MKETECLGLPYPECAPPLVKDASDIEQFRDLAEATDAAVQEFADQLTDTLLSPPIALMDGGQNAAGLDVTHFYSVVIFDNGSMANTTLDGITIPEDGWYMIGGFVRATDGLSGQYQVRIEPLRNGETFSSRQGTSYPVDQNDVAWSEVAFFQAGDFLNTMTHRTGLAATVITYDTQLWAFQVLANV